MRFMIRIRTAIIFSLFRTGLGRSLLTAVLIGFSVLCWEEACIGVPNADYCASGYGADGVAGAGCSSCDDKHSLLMRTATYCYYFKRTSVVCV